MLFLLLSVASMGNAQSNSGSSTNGSESSSSSTAKGTSNAIVNQTSSTAPGFVQAIPGGIPGTFPGYAPENPACFLYAVIGLPPLTDQVINSMARGGKIPHWDRVTVIDPSATTPYPGAIGLMRYNPRVEFNPGDKILGSIRIPGVYMHTDEQLVGISLRALKKAVPAMQRATIIDCPVAKSMTKANTFGFGIASSGTPESGNVGSGGALGFTHGSIWAEKEVASVFYIYAMNDGKLDYIPPQKVAPPASVQAQPTPLPIPTPQPEAKALTPPPPPPPSIIATTTIDRCALPTVNIYFRFDHPKVNEGSIMDPTVMTEDGPKDNAGAIASIERWLENHPSCKIDVVGYADHRGSSAYNNDLGERRPDAVFEILIKNEKIRNQVFEADSNGKENAVPAGSKETNWRDRRVSFRVRGSDSTGR